MYIMIEMFPFSQLVYKLMILQPLTSNNTMYGDTNVVGDYMGGEGRGKEGKGEGVSLRNLILLVASSSLTAVVASLFIQYLATCYMMKEVVFIQYLATCYMMKEVVCRGGVRTLAASAEQCAVTLYPLLYKSLH